MSDEPQAGGGEERGFLSTTKGLVSGLTGLIVAVTGLFVAYDKLRPSKGAAGVETAAPAQQVAGPPATEEQAPAIELYTGDQLRMEWTGKDWRLISPDGISHYEEMLSTEGAWVLGFDKANNEYIRWPIDGGTMEYSQDDRASWTTYGEVQPENAG
jgi:hypothetical protein